MINFLRRKVFGNGNPTDQICILYGSHSGNSEFVANETQKYLRKNGMKTSVANLAKYDFSKLEKEKSLLLIISTHGEGEPPESAQKFCKKLLSNEAPSLSHLHFSVCALGDSSYQHFCQTGKELDNRLEQLGANRFHDRADCDVEFHRQAADWVSAVLSKLQPSAKTEVPVQLSAEKATVETEAILKSKKLLNKQSAAKTWHLEFEICSDDFCYAPGDTVSIVPENNEKLVTEILRHIGCAPEEKIEVDEEEISAKELLTNKLEITKLSRNVLENYLQLTQNPELEKLFNAESNIQEYLDKHDVLDLITNFPFSGNAAPFFTILRKLQAREYSVSSSQTKHSGEIHLTVKQVTKEDNARTYRGACSTFLADHDTGKKVTMKLVKNEEFRIQNGGVPMILIGAGTGIAPFRAFLEEKEALGHNGKIWLIFGEKNRSSDFFYENELNDWLEKEILNRIDLAFSRDQREKIYVQHKIAECNRDFMQWINEGAHLYICGSIAMGHSVKESITEIFRNAGRPEIWSELIEENRVHLDVY
jgi:sulfite reductase (NADPH) flavoprotein alpha-component